MQNNFQGVFIALFSLFFLSPFVGFSQPLKVDVSIEEPLPNEDFSDENFSLDETEIPYEDFSEHSSEEPLYEETVEPQMSLQNTVGHTIDSHPLLSLETTGSIFDQFADFEKSKMLMSLQTEEEKMQLERDRIKLQRLKLERELLAFEKKIESDSDGDSDESILKDDVNSEKESVVEAEEEEEKYVPKTFDEIYKIKTIMGVGKRLIAVLKNTINDTKTQVKIGTEIDGYIVRKITPKKGIVVEKDGEKILVEIE
ncbi:MAG: hypothetical protein ACTSXV_01380 [Alphaproteobacteria bacterium]